MVSTNQRSQARRIVTGAAAQQPFRAGLQHADVRRATVEVACVRGKLQVLQELPAATAASASGPVSDPPGSSDWL